MFTSLDYFSGKWHHVNESTPRTDNNLHVAFAGGNIGPLCFAIPYLCHVAYTYPTSCAPWNVISLPVGIVGGSLLNICFISQTILSASDERNTCDSITSIAISSFFSYGAYSTVNAIAPAFGGLSCCCIIPISGIASYASLKMTRGIRVTFEACKQCFQEEPESDYEMVSLSEAVLS